MKREQITKCRNLMFRISEKQVYTTNAMILGALFPHKNQSLARTNYTNVKRNIFVISGHFVAENLRILPHIPGSS